MPVSDITIEVEVLRKALSHLSKVVKPNKAIPILGYVMLTGKDGKVSLAGTNHQVYYTMTLDVESDFCGTLMLNVAEVSTMLSRLKTGLVSFAPDGDGRLVISSGTSTWRRESRSTADMPTFPTLSEDMYQSVSREAFMDSVTNALRATPKKVSFNPGLTQVHIHDGVIDSGDGMLYQRVPSPLDTVDTTIPVGSARLMNGILRAWAEDTVTVGHTDTHTIVRGDTQTLGIMRTREPFPNISRHLKDPQITHTEKLSVLVPEFLTAVQSVALSSPQETGLITIDLYSSTKIRLSAKSMEGDATAVCSATWEGKDGRIVRVDHRNLVDVIAATGEKEQITLAFGADTLRNPSSVFLQSNGTTAALMQLRGR